ncbi:putative cadherin domain protein [Trichinella nativa]|uniref:Putative cadherin domain protein n=1 Tax=Trichinella nativa TaxID=6335 RepID=A0A1Y3ETA5_9BILA|nr:putative cadherin domain protein [Trichinella nativa]
MAILYDGSPVGTAVMTVKATDPDEGLNGHVQYFIDSSSAGDFSLDPVYGTLRVNTMLNKKSYKLTIWAYDQGENQLRTSSDLNVVLLDTSVNHFILEADSTEITVNAFLLFLHKHVSLFDFLRFLKMNRSEKFY